MLPNFFEVYSNVIGIVGVVCVLAGYFLLQINKISQNNFWFSFVNLLGAVLILISLMYHWNLASVIIEIAWLTISLYGMVVWMAQQMKYKKQAKLQK
jgi:membrane-bound ClpP family serine protease